MAYNYKQTSMESSMDQEVGYDEEVVDSVKLYFKQSFNVERGKTMATLDKNFLEYTTNELALAIGPIAPFIVEEAIENLGHKGEHIPFDDVDVFIDMISCEIPREEKKTIFRTNIKAKIPVK